jgi:hypothetical protein
MPGDLLVQNSWQHKQNKYWKAYCKEINVPSPKYLFDITKFEDNIKTVNAKQLRF